MALPKPIRPTSTPQQDKRGIASGKFTASTRQTPKPSK